MGRRKVKFSIARTGLLLAFTASAAAPFAQATAFQGRVYDGEVGDESRALAGVTVSLYGANNPYPDTGMFIRSTTTNESGWYQLEANPGWEFYHIIESNPDGFSSVGATSVSGTIRSADWIEYIVPLDGKTLTGNKFWDIQPAGPTPTPTRVPTPTSHAQRDPDADAYRTSHAQRDPDADTYRASHAQRDPDADAYRASHAQRDPDADAYRASHAQRDPDADTRRRNYPVDMRCRRRRTRPGPSRCEPRGRDRAEGRVRAGPERTVRQPNPASLRPVIRSPGRVDR